MTVDGQSAFPVALERHEFEFTASIRKKLQKYCQLLWRANENVNLTRHTDYDTFVARDLVDVMQLSNLVEQENEVLDIGSGGGVPGVVLAIVRPDLQISVCDSVGKKAVLLKEFVDELGLSVAVYNDRAETVLDDIGFDCCTARAAGPMWKLLTWLADHWPHARRLYTFKGPKWIDEVTEAKSRGLTKGLLISPVVKYPLFSTDKDADPINSYIVKVTRDKTL